MATTRKHVLSLYRNLIRESSKFSAYNFRNYALRRIRDTFRQHKDLNDNNMIANQISDAEKNLELIRRQVLIGQLYRTDKLVIENVTKR